jgi:hypothetical protein
MATLYRSITSCSGENGRNRGVSPRTISRLAVSKMKKRTPNTNPNRILDQKTLQNALEKWTSRNHRRST